MENALVLKDVSKVYAAAEGGAVPALQSISLQVAKGEFLALMGPSGCGKSTLLHVMGGMDRPTSGEVWLDDIALHSLSEEALTQIRRHRVGFIFQFFYLLPTMTVLENVELPLLLARRSKATEDAQRLLERVGLESRMNARPSTLSGGEMQRVAVARALVANPAVVLADEPTGNLDTDNGRIVLGMLREVARERGVAVVMATHSPEASDYADRCVEMKDGHLLESCHA